MPAKRSFDSLCAPPASKRLCTWLFTLDGYSNAEIEYLVGVDVINDNGIRWLFFGFEAGESGALASGAP